MRTGWVEIMGTTILDIVEEYIQIAGRAVFILAFIDGRWISERFDRYFHLFPYGEDGRTPYVMFLIILEFNARFNRIGEEVIAAKQVNRRSDQASVPRTLRKLPNVDWKIS